MKPFSIYIHIPFCLHKCPYCDFNTYAVPRVPEEEYIEALLAELDYRLFESAWRGREVQTIYFGGGTPSLFSGGGIRSIISFICRRLPVATDAEISMEINPGTASIDLLSSFHAAGVNRASFGVQSFQSRVLKTLGRMHTPEQAEIVVDNARAAGFQNVSIDLIYGVPNQSMDDLHADLNKVQLLNPDHISAYGLTIEKGTPFFQRYRTGRLKLLDEGLVVDMMETLCQRLEEIDLNRYEISNFAKPGYEARHNMAYWDGDDYLGLGAGAHSFSSLGRMDAENAHPARWANYALPNKYMKEAISKGKAESWSDTLSEKDLMFEFFFLGLRKCRGVRLDDFSARFGSSVYEVYPTLMKVLSQQGYLQTRDGYLALTQKGLLFADTVIENFIEAEEQEPSAPLAANL